MKKIALIFDFDGTLADTFPVIKDILNGLSFEFGFRRIEEKDIEKLRGMSAREIIKESRISWWKVPRLVKRGKAAMSLRIEEMSPVTGIQTALRRLEENGHKLFIVSSNSKENIEKFLAKHKLAGVFDFIDVEKSLWGKGKILKKLMKKEKLAPDNVIYVGDETRDIEAARKAGVKAIAVAWGFNTEAALKKHNPDYLAQKPEELIEIVGKL